MLTIRRDQALCTHCFHVIVGFCDTLRIIEFGVGSTDTGGLEIEIAETDAYVGRHRKNPIGVL
jgi:hypothetical protein